MFAALQSKPEGRCHHAERPEHKLSPQDVDAVIEAAGTEHAEVSSPAQIQPADVRQPQDALTEI
jgi:hypothetical protein